MRFLLQLYVFIASLVVLLMAVLYVRHLNERARHESNFSTGIISRMLGLYLETEEIQRNTQRIRQIMDEISVNAPFPIIIVDKDGRPTWWKVTGYPSYKEYGFEKLISFDPAEPPDDNIAELMRMAARFKGEDNAVVFYYPGTPTRVQGLICYGQSDLARNLGKAIAIQLMMLLVFSTVGVLGFFVMKRFEQESIWVGLAKETAHQMGTPLTSLLGWIQLGESRLETASLPPATADAFRDAFGEMSSDVERLQKVSARFNNIGGTPALKRGDLRPVVERTVLYFRRRLPQHKVQVEIRDQYDEVPMVRFHAELMEWVVENLVKNGLDALDKDKGLITVTLSYNGTEGTVDLHVRDNGRGMSPSVRRRIFRPGYSSKKGGWGLGLTLSRRVVEEYHGGRLQLLDSHPGHGTCFVVRLPV
ncbi:MAG: HAMP domain-containing sensor histidine kinase [Candidatus Krumholzibacteriia bacterium]|nr:HAMP domain-containing histidine kinase [bacterium]MCB9514150.1 HAMP domain-containing histidine kinase [Candidatus Latescibacterota bacterium]MCB9515810.1 HAMP domain-containing histidine kinase [Candidatus Latescibacterota bacterium]